MFPGLVRVISEGITSVHEKVLVISAQIIVLRVLDVVTLSGQHIKEELATSRARRLFPDATPGRTILRELFVAS